MKIVAKILLCLIFLACVVLGVYLWHGPREKETWATLIALLAVFAAIIAVLPTFRIIELQEDVLRPRPTPYFDLNSRYQMLQLRIKNVGGGVAYNVELKWKSPLTNHEGEEVTFLDRITSLLPQESVSTLVGQASKAVTQLSSSRFEGKCFYQDSTGKKYCDNFSISVDAHQKRLLHDDELPRTLYDLQDIPKQLSRIADLIDRR